MFIERMRKRKRVRGGMSEEVGKKKSERGRRRRGGEGKIYFFLITIYLSLSNNLIYYFM
jgi:hypothetical protein